MLARAAERRDTVGETTTTGRNAGCDPRSVPDCAMPSSLGEDRENLPSGTTAPARPPRSRAPLQRAEEVSHNQTTRPDGTTLSDDLRSGYPASVGSPETVLTSTRVEMNSQLNSAPRTPGYGGGENLSAPFATINHDATVEPIVDGHRDAKVRPKLRTVPGRAQFYYCRRCGGRAGEDGAPTESVCGCAFPL